MRQLASAICLVMTLFAAPVQAVETFTLRYAGTGFDPANCTQQGCPITPWISTVTVQTVSGSDGVYSFNAYPPDNPGTLTFLSLVSDPLSLHFNFSTQDPFLLGGLTATVQGGHVTSIDGLIVGEFQASWHFAGPEVDFNQPMFEKAGPFSGHAAVVPEPETYALMIAGLAAGALGRRRARSSP